MKEGDPEMYGLLKQEFELQRQTVDVAVQHRRAPESQRPVVKKELEELVDRHFDIRQKRRQLELKRLEEDYLQSLASVDIAGLASEVTVLLPEQPASDSTE